MSRTLYEELQDFRGREEDLRSVKRYNHSLECPMHHRTDLWIHSARVRKIVRYLSPIVAKVVSTPFDAIFTETMALVHDDPEIITGDISAALKSEMTAEERAELHKKELAAIETLALRFPVSLGGYTYRELVLHAHESSSFEKQLLKFADRFDALGESLHETLAGNQGFAMDAPGPRGLVVPGPIYFYVTHFENCATHYPDLTFLVEGPHKIIDLDGCRNVDWAKIAASSSAHTIESIQRDTPYQPYNLWKHILLADNDQNEIQQLVTRVEE